MLGYYLSGVTAIRSKSTSGDKASSYLLEGLRMAQGTYQDWWRRIVQIIANSIAESLKAPTVERAALSTASQRYQWHMLSSWYIRLQLALLACQRADWRAARHQLDNLQADLKESAIELTDDITRWLRYLNATISQAAGDMSTALSIFRSDIFALPTNANRANDAHTDLKILAGLNTLLIIRFGPLAQPVQFAELLSGLEPFCLNHPNKSIHSAFYLMRAVAPRTDASTIVKVKQHLQLALQDAKAASNDQLLAISLNLMTALFFKNIVGEQAEKSARTGQAVARRGKSQLWTTVANGMLADTLSRCGKAEEAAKVRGEAERGVAALPAPLAALCSENTSG